ncbi:MAG TPA: hypothetical protein VKY89_09960, partial [Thermoanaerobaculia bacterium]|nr:hypothetical protein [Thermoanaerobaculia bacterium]
MTGSSLRLRLAAALTALLVPVAAGSAIAAGAPPPAQYMQYGLAPASQGQAAGGMPSPFQRLGFDQRVG